MHDKKKNQLIKTDPELMQMLALVDKDTKLVILTVFLKLQKLRHGRFLFFFLDPDQASRVEKYNV